MSAAELPAGSGAIAGVELKSCRTGIVELAAHGGRTSELATVAVARGCALPPLGRAMATTGQLAIGVRPGRWLVLQAPEEPASPYAQWEARCAGTGTVVDLSSALAVLKLCGPEARAILARSCRLDLDPQHFPSGRAAATIIAQVATVIVAMPRGLLLLTPSTTARHFCEWLVATARPYGIGTMCDVSLAEMLAE